MDHSLINFLFWYFNKNAQVYIVNRLRYDTIRYDKVDLRALKSWRDGQLNLAHGPETKNNEKNKNQKLSSKNQKKRVAVLISMRLYVNFSETSFGSLEK